MITEFGFDSIDRDDRSVITVGTYDGVHRGHQAILRYLRQRAEAVQGIATVVSFDPHPREVVMGEQVPLLTTLEERAALLADFGVHRFVVLPFTRDLSMVEADDYVRDILVGTIGLREIVIGYDHAFGRDRRGNRQTLESIGTEAGFTVDVIPKQIVEDVAVSSSRIRSALTGNGDVAAASALLGRPYSLEASVVRGDGRGRGLGFPTANLRPLNDRKLIPGHGVYAVLVYLADRELQGMMNIGSRPTVVNDGGDTLEVHLFDLDEDLYGCDLRVSFIARIRDEKRFDGIEALVAQLRDDEVAARHALASN